jgi:D-alanine-D-alanine ligase
VITFPPILQRPQIVAVITGSHSGERYYESSPWIEHALLEKGYLVVRYGVDETPDLISELRSLRRQVESLAERRGAWLEVIAWPTGLGVGGGEDGTWAAVFETLLPGMPYVGSSPRACQIALDKEASKDAFRAVGLSVPDGVCFLPYPTITGGLRYAVSNLTDHCYLTSSGQPDFSRLVERLGRPLVIKPSGSGASLGLAIVDNARSFETHLRSIGLRYGPLLVEQYIESHSPDAQVEYSVPLLEGVLLPAFEVRAETVYDTETKISGSHARPIQGELAERLLEAAWVAHRYIGCRGLARVDFRVTPSDEIYALELNASPGAIAKWSIVAQAAAAIKLPYNDLIERWLMTAHSPHRRAVPPLAAQDAPPFPEAFRHLLPDLPVELQPPGFYQPVPSTEAREFAFINNRC